MKILENRYVLDDSVATRSGGMAEIRKARDMNNATDVAIKFFGKDFASDKFTAEAFARESKNLQSLDHPSVVKVLDGGVDPDDQRRYLVLEWLEFPLSEYLKTRPLAGWDDFYEIVGRPILDGLSHAFVRDIIHRDLKPKNVLVDLNGSLKITDFGISKFKRAVELGTTLSGFRTEPYAPPERDDGRHSDTRDVFSFAVLALECLSERPPFSYDDVYKMLAEFDAPSEVVSIIISCLDQDPDQRPKNIPCLANALDAVQTERARAWIEIKKCYITVSREALATIRRQYPHLSESAARDLISGDLAESCASRTLADQIVVRRQTESAVAETSFRLIGERYSYKAVIDDSTRDHLVIASVSAMPAGLLDTLRLDAWKPAVEFKIGKPPASDDARDFIDWFAAGIAEYEQAQAEKSRSESLERVYKAWQQILNAREGLERLQRRNLQYTSVRKDGSRLHFTVTGAPEEDVIGEPWSVPLPNGRAISGEVDAVGDGFLVLWSDSPFDQLPPKRGELRFDTRATRKALQKQRAALDAIRFERSVRPQLKRLLADPTESEFPVHEEVSTFFQADLDEDKRVAVSQALGSKDFLFVEGPPGTGKTRLISEIVLQTLKKKPAHRVLLTSQTHIALDNALERILKLSPDLKLVRIGRRQDPRVAESVKGLLLDNQADEWLTQVRKRSLAFLDDWADKHGVDRSEVLLGMAISRLRLALIEEATLSEKIDQLALELAAVKLEQSNNRAESGTTYHEQEEKAQQLEENLAGLRSDLVKAKEVTRLQKKIVAANEDLGVELSKQTAEELKDWEDDLLNKDATRRRCKELIELAEEWELRFGRSSDFHGALLADAQVVAGTCIGFMGARGIQDIAFDLCIVDEASKANVTELLVPLSRAHSWIVVGDRKQLPPFVEQALDSESLLAEYGVTKEDIRQTLIDHLADQLPQECQAQLIHQHRMRWGIGDFISACFYDGRLVSSKDEGQYPLSHALAKPVTWYSTSKLPERAEIAAKPSFTNQAEIDIALKILHRLNFVAKAKSEHYSVAFLTGYGAQRLAFERAVAKIERDIEFLTVTVNTVDAFQGREADVAIYSITRSNDRNSLGFLREQKRLNVALSRARIGLAIVGDHMFCRSASGENPFDEILHYIVAEPATCLLDEVEP